MLDNLNPRDGAAESRRERPRRAHDAQTITDREVPLSSTSAHDSVNRWLDGETEESTVNPKMVRLWQRIGEETERRRQVAAPADLTERIMASLPSVEPEVAADESWWTRPIEITPALAVAAAAGLIVIGAAINASFRMR